MKSKRKSIYYNLKILNENDQRHFFEYFCFVFLAYSSVPRKLTVLLMALLGERRLRQLGFPK
jgi:hypothetical protein